MPPSVGETVRKRLDDRMRVISINEPQFVAKAAALDLEMPHGTGRDGEQRADVALILQDVGDDGEVMTRLHQNGDLLEDLTRNFDLPEFAVLEDDRRRCGVGSGG